MTSGPAGDSDRRRPWRFGRFLPLIVAALAVMAAVPAALAAKPPQTPIAHAAAGNPPLSTACGLRVLLVLDSSGSVGTEHTPAVQGAARAFVSALSGTGSQLSITRFAQNAFALGQQANVPMGNTPDALRARATPHYFVVNQDNIDNHFEPFIDGYNATAGGSTAGEIGNHNATNWEAALTSATLGTRPDLVVFVTDGNPTVNGFPGTPATPGNSVTDWERALPFAVTAANLVKEHTRIFALGVGDAFTQAGTAGRFTAITGPNQLGPDFPFYDRENPARSADWTLERDFGALAGELRSFITELCAPSVIITKLTQGIHGDPVVSHGWSFTAHLMTSEGGHKWTRPMISDPFADEATTTSDEEGIARFEWSIEHAHANSTISITREHRPGVAFRFGAAQCLKHTPGSLPVTIAPSPDYTAIPHIELGPEEYATCRVLNLEHAGTIELIKRIIPSDDPGMFNLLLNGDVIRENIDAPGGETDPVTLPLGTHEVSEEAAHGTDLAHYHTTVECVDVHNHNRVVVPLHAATHTNVPLVTDGEGIVCIFTNTSNQDGQITVIKHLIPHGSGTFDLVAGTTTVAHGVGDGGHGSVRVPFGSHTTVTEHGAGGTNLSHFQISTVCINESTGHVVAHNDTGPTVHVPVTRDAPYVQCTITNHRPDVPVGHLEVIKHLTPEGSGLFDLVIGGIAFARDVGHLGTTGPLQVELGTHEVTEQPVAAAGTNLANFAISTTCVNTAAGNAVVAQNLSGPDVAVHVTSTADNIVCTITNALDSPPEAGGGGEVPPPPPGVLQPLLSVVKTLPGQAPIGAVVPIRITVHNNGRTAAHGVQLAETRPTGLQIVSVAGGTLDANDTAVWHIGTLAPGASATVHATARVLALGLHVDTAIATAANADPALSDAAVRAAAHAPVPPGVAPPPLVTG